MKKKSQPSVEHDSGTLPEKRKPKKIPNKSARSEEFAANAEIDLT